MKKLLKLKRKIEKLHQKVVKNIINETDISEEERNAIHWDNNGKEVAYSNILKSINKIINSK